MYTLRTTTQGPEQHAYIKAELILASLTRRPRTRNDVHTPTKGDLMYSCMHTLKRTQSPGPGWRGVLPDRRFPRGHHHHQEHLPTGGDWRRLQPVCVCVCVCICVCVCCM